MSVLKMPAETHVSGMSFTRRPRMRSSVLIGEVAETSPVTGARIHALLPLTTGDGTIIMDGFQ